MIIIFWYYLQRNMLRPAYNHLFLAIGIAFPVASLSWPKRRLYMYMIPVAIISISANIPEIHSVLGHFLGFEVTFDKWNLVLFYTFFYTYVAHYYNRSIISGVFVVWGLVLLLNYWYYNCNSLDITALHQYVDCHIVEKTEEIDGTCSKHKSNIQLSK